jgi:hypothetical protein
MMLAFDPLEIEFTTESTEKTLCGTCDLCGEIRSWSRRKTAPEKRFRSSRSRLAGSDPRFGNREHSLQESSSQLPLQSSALPSRGSR